MTWKKISRGLLFSAGMVGGAVAGHLFYIGRLPSGTAMLALTALFLFFAMAELNIVSGRAPDDDFLPGNDADFRRAVGELAAIVADNAVGNAKNIGRTLPLSPTELSKLEDVLIPVLSDLNASAGEKKRIAEEFDKLRTRSRQSEGRRALSGRL